MKPGFFAGVLLLLAGAALAGSLHRIVLAGYSGEAMEPFVSRDGRHLFFNTRNDPGVDTNIMFAERVGAGWRHLGVLPGTVSPQLDGTPAMSAAGRFCFLSTRAYFETLVTVYCGRFDGQRVVDARAQQGLKARKVGLLAFDVDLSADGQTMILAEGSFSGGAVPDAADLHFASWNGQGYVREPEQDHLLSRINTPALEYAPALSADGLELYFTRMEGFWLFRTARILVARRPTPQAAFGEPVEVAVGDGFVEGPTLVPGGALMFHKRVDNRFELWQMPLPGR